MAKQISMVEEIFPNTPNPWTVKVTVIEKMLPRQPISSPKKYQRLILVDSVGTRVQATIFGPDIQLFKNNLVLYKKYYISNASVKSIESKHRLVPHEYQWIIHNRALVVEIDDDAPEVVQPSLTFVPLIKLVDYKDLPETVDVVACALCLLPKKQQNTRNGLATIQELILVDSDLQPVVLTMWNQFIVNEIPALESIVAKRPIIAVMRVKVVSYNAVSLSTRSTSSLVVKPINQDANILQSWLNDNNDKLDELLTSKHFLELAHLDNDSTNHIVQIASLDSLPDHKIYALRCELAIIDIHQSFWYMGCSNCHRSTSALYMERFTCNFCRRKDVQGFPRCRITVEASDSSDKITASIFGTDAEQLISCDAMSLMKMENAEQIGSVIRTHSDGPITVHVKATNSEYKGEKKRRFTISFMQDSIDNSDKTVVTNLEERFLKHDEANEGKGKFKVIGFGTTNDGSL